MVRTLRFALISALTALTVFAVVAVAQQSATPTPGCFGMQITDPAGDSTVAGADVTGGWFDTVGGKVYANFAVKDLAAPTEASPTQLRWYFLWNVGDVTNFVRASSDGTFAGGDQGDTGFNTVETTLPGKFFPGADGVIQIQVPAGRAGKGKKLELPNILVKQAVGNSTAALLVADPDRAPDEGEGKAYTVAECGGAPVTEPTPPPANQPPSQQQPQADTLAVTAPTKVKTPKGKSLALKLKSSGKVTNLEGVFGKGTKTLGRGKLASLNSKGTLKIKLSKKVKKGSYTLYLRGTNPNGQPADKTFKLKLK